VDRRQRADLVPARLLTFNPKDWATSAEEQRWQLFQRWVDARKVWAEEHPESIALGNALERFKFELATVHPGAIYPRHRREEELGHG
jgi:hypothetical protein